MPKDYQKVITGLLESRPIAFNPVLSKITGSIGAGLLLSQFLYWHGKGTDKQGWFYKTMRELEEETSMTRKNQDSAIRRLKQLGLIEYELKGVPAKRYFRVSLSTLVKLVCPKVANWNVQKEQTITEITTENTTEIEKINKKKIGNLMESFYKHHAI